MKSLWATRIRNLEVGRSGQKWAERNRAKQTCHHLEMPTGTTVQREEEGSLSDSLLRAGFFLR